jgi:hypothetical protein
MKRCISRDTISNERAKREEILQFSSLLIEASGNINNIQYVTKKTFKLQKCV